MMNRGMGDESITVADLFDAGKNRIKINLIIV
jgi:hypothetical protein